MRSQIEFPKANDINTRLAWAGERAWDIAEGLVSATDAAMILTVVIGWSDLASADDKAAYIEMARRLTGIIEAVAA